MRMNRSAIRSLGWTWSAALATLALGVAGLAAAVVLPAGPGTCAQPSLLPVAAGLMALLSAVLGLVSAPLALAATDEPADPLQPAPRDLAAELAAMLEEGREALQRTRSGFESAIDGAARTGARLTVAALDAERRLGALVTRAQNGAASGAPTPVQAQAVDGTAIEIMRHAAETARRATDQLDRIEQSLPRLLGTFTHAAAAADSGISSALDRMETTASVLERGSAVFAVLPQAAAQIAEASESVSHACAEFAEMRQGLQQIGQEAATLSDAAGRIESASAGLGQISQELTQTRFGLATLPAAMDRIEDVAVGLAHVSDAFAQSGAALAGLPAAAERIDAAGAGLARTADAFARSGAALAALPATAERFDAAAHGLVQASGLLAQSGAALAGLPAAAGRIEATAHGLAQVSDALSRSETALAALPATVAQVETAARGLAQASDTLVRSGDAMAALPATASRMEAAAAGLAQASENFACNGALLSDLPDTAGRIEAAISELAGLSGMLAHSCGALTVLPATAGRIEAAVGGLVQISDTLGTASERIDSTTTGMARICDDSAAQGAALIRTLADTAGDLVQSGSTLARRAADLAEILPVPGALQAAAERLDAISQRAETRAGTHAAQLNAAIAEAESAAAGLANTLAGLAGLPGTVGQLQLAAGRIETGTAGFADCLDQTTHQLGTLRSAAEAVDASTHHLDRAAARVETQAQQVESALGRTREALQMLQAALEAMPSGAPPRAAPAVASGAIAAHGSVAAALLADLPDADRGPELTTTLNRLGGVETEVGRLLREAEDLAEQAVTRKSPALPSAVARRAPALLNSLDQTVRQLQSVSTALALACDGGR